MRACGFAAVVAACLACGCAPRAGQDPARLLADASHQIKYGDLDTALALADRAAALAKEAPADGVEAWRPRLLRAEIFLLKREIEAAGTLLGAAPPGHPSFAPLAAKRTALLGQLQILSGKATPDTVDTLATAERMATDAGYQDAALGARGLRGQLLLRLGRWDEGRAALEALAAEAQKLGDEYHQSIGLINLGIGYRIRDRFDEALPYFERAAALERVTMRLRAPALTNAAVCYTRLGDYDRAIAMQRKAVEGHRASAPEFLAQALGELGTTFYLKGDFTQAASNLERALQVASDARSPDSAVWAAHLALVHIQLGAWDEAAGFNRRSRELTSPDDVNRLVYNTLYDGDIAAGRGDRAAAKRYYEAALAQAGTDPFNVSDAHAGLARLELGAGRPAEAGRHFEAALAVIERTQSGLLKTDYKFTYLARLSDVYGQYIGALVAERRFDRALEIADSSRARVLAERHGISPGARRSAREFRLIARRTGSTALAYWIGRERSFGWAVTADGIRGITLPGAAEIESLVRAHQQAIVTSLADPLQSEGTPGDKLYALLVDPFADVLRPGTPVILVADGALSHVNFETLPVAGGKRRYWIEDVALTVAPSLGVLAAALRTAPANRNSVLLIGDPTVADPEYPRLRYASAEIEAVGNAFPRAQKTVYRGDRASPQTFREARLESFGLIHFTAHASANAESPLDSAVILARDEDGYKLYARDIAEERLNADLVTISACRSAGDRAYSGEGLVGFAWAFLRAGARRVLAGLWDVDDRSTAELMTMTYAGLAKGDPPAVALRAAKLALLARGGSLAKPYYWGPFQLIAAAP